jgi:transcriptional regulator with XRE-family HTH domain
MQKTDTPVGTEDSNMLSPGIDSLVGKAVKSRRKLNNLTLAQLSERSGVSAAMISRIENGQSSASLSSLQQIAAALSVPVISLFEHTLESSDINFVRADEGLKTVRVTAEESHWYNILGKHDNSSMSFTASSVTLRKSDQARFPVYQGGGFIFLYARDGSAIYRCGDQRFEMTDGDTLSFDARLSNGFESLISETFSFISVFAQPL